MNRKAKSIISILLVSVCLFSVFNCCTSAQASHPEANEQKKKIAVLLVNHGSRSETWRNALLNLEAQVKDSILKQGKIQEVQTVFMEYTEPSIATRLKELDSKGFTDVIMVPVFLTVSPHSFDDIPTIIGQKEDPQSLEVLKVDKIERYTPKAKVQIAPLLDFTDILQKNILKRFQTISREKEKEGIVLLAYGDGTYLKEWSELLSSVGKYVETSAGISGYSFGWCGHIAHYSPDSTTAAINRVLRKKEKAVVIPVLVAHDEMFQVKIIGDGIAKIPDYKNRVIYKPDALLPDENIERWIIQITRDFETRISGENTLN